MWFNYPVEKHSLRFYKYKFEGQEKKQFVIEAYNKIEARKKLYYLIEKNRLLNKVKVIDETVTLPVFGRTTKNINSIEHIWVKNLTPSGWMPKSEFDKLDL